MHHRRVSIIALAFLATSSSVGAGDEAAAPDDDEDLVALATLDSMFTPGGCQDEPADLDDEALPGQALPERFGSVDTKRFQIHGAGGFDIDGSSNSFALGGVGWETFFAENLSWNLELNALYVSQVSDDAWGINANLLLRWHFHDQGSWTIFADAGAGVVMFTEDVPRNGSNFNFTPQAGGGATFELDGDARLVVGVRWHHISNASLYSGNPGRDSVLIYGGVSFPF